MKLRVNLEDGKALFIDLSQIEAVIINGDSSSISLKSGQLINVSEQMAEPIAQKWINV